MSQKIWQLEDRRFSIVQTLQIILEFVFFGLVGPHVLHVRPDEAVEGRGRVVSVADDQRLVLPPEFIGSYPPTQPVWRCNKNCLNDPCFSKLLRASQYVTLSDNVTFFRIIKFECLSSICDPM